jgi:type IV pilus assembly protein PilX
MIMKKPILHPDYSRQRGATLLITMIMMLLITLIAVTALKNSTQQTKLMATASRKDNTFQQSESLLAQHTYDTLSTKLVSLFDSSESDPNYYTSTDEISSKLDETSKLIISTKARLLGTRRMSMPGGQMYSVKEDAPVPYVIEVSSNAKFDTSGIETTIRQGRIVIAQKLR